MQATVLQVGNGQLLVQDQSTSQQVLVNTSIAGCFAVGNQVFITYNGVMTASTPPQNRAMTSCRTPRCRGDGKRAPAASNGARGAQLVEKDSRSSRPQARIKF